MSNEGRRQKTKPCPYKHVRVSGRLTYKHRAIYEQHFGSIPPGHEVHHKDENKLNNDPGNLEILPVGEHKRLHAGWKLIDGAWWKPCTRCRELKPLLTGFHQRKAAANGLNHCKPCHSIDERERLAKAKAKRLLEVLLRAMPEIGPQDA
jgi:hypothetical protein